MLDYNRTPKFADVLNAVVDAALTAENAACAPRDYLGGSRIVGVDPAFFAPLRQWSASVNPEMVERTVATLWR